TQAYNNGVVDVLQLTTNEGLTITGTPNHKFKVMTETGLAWKRLDELQAGDAILVKLGQHQGTIQTLVLPTQQHGNQILPQFPTVLDEDVAFFLGYLAGDGFTASAADDHRLGVSVAHTSYLLDEMPILLQK